MENIRLPHIASCLAALLSLGNSLAQTPVAPRGAGTSGNPYLIASIDNLAWVSMNSAEWNGCFKQTADIDASATAAWDGLAGFTPIGNGAVPFKGNYDGNGKTISHLTIRRDSADYIGLFGRISRCKISDLAVTSASIRGRNYVGILVGNADSAEVFNCKVAGAVTGSRSIGGLAGRAGYGKVLFSSSSATVAGMARNSSVGGLFGNATDARVISCFSTGSVTSAGNQSNTGGFAGAISGFTSHSFSTGKVTATGDSGAAGGFAGWVTSGSSSRPMLQNCYSASPIGPTGDVDIGGFAGNVYSSTIANNCYWDTQVSGTPTSAIGTGLTTAAMKTQGSFAGWNFEYVWGMNPNGYPHLLPSSTAWPPGSGTQIDPYRVSTLANLYIISTNKEFWDKSFVQTADIDAAASRNWAGDSGWSPFGTNELPFSGVYDGKGKTISNIALNRNISGYSLGFFGVAKGPHCRIKNLHLRDIAITNLSTVSGTGLQGPCTGGMAGKLNGGARISNSSVTGTITGPNTSVSIGGLVGCAENAFVENSYSDCAITGFASSNTGGLIGIRSNSPVLNCYSASNTSIASPNPKRNGGLIGYDIEASYSTLFNCFWDKQKAGPDSSASGSPKTTAEMQTQSTFTGWDFNDCWILQAGTYPGLRAPVEIVATEPQGTGTESDPYLIATLEHLAWLTRNTGAWNSYFRQTADIDASATAHWENGAGWRPVGYDSCLFRGGYDGNGKSITGLAINRPNDIHSGFFGRAAGKGCRIRNVTLDSATIVGLRYTGGLVGQADTIEMTGCRVAGNVTAMGPGAHLGGLAGTFYYSKMIRCRHVGAVSGSRNQIIGGLAGFVGNDSIVNCSKSGPINAMGDYCTVGGLVGELRSGSAKACTTSFEIKAVGRELTVGGLIGHLGQSGRSDAAFRCLASGSIAFDDVPTRITGGRNTIGGLVGESFGISAVSMCMNRANISGSGYSTVIGGLIGDNTYTTFSQCGTTGSIAIAKSQTANISGGGNTVGGIAGYSSSGSPYVDCFGIGTISVDNSGSITTLHGFSPDTAEAAFKNCYSARMLSFTGIRSMIPWQACPNCYWNLETAGIILDSAVSKPTGITTAQMKTESIYSNSGWDFKDIWQMDPAVNDGYPSFRWLYGTLPVGTARPPAVKVSPALTVSDRGNTVTYALPEAGHVSLKVFNLKGARVAVLIDETQPAGRYRISGLRERFRSGYYLLAFRAGKFRSTRKVAL